MKVGRPVIIAAALIMVWQVLVSLTGVEHFILPSPLRVANALIDRFDLILEHAWITLAEIQVWHASTDSDLVTPPVYRHWLEEFPELVACWWL